MNRIDNATPTMITLILKLDLKALSRKVTLGFSACICMDIILISLFRILQNVFPGLNTKPCQYRTQVNLFEP